MSNAPSKPVSFSRPKVGYFSNRPRILGGSVHSIKENVEALIVVNKETGLEVNAVRTKYMVMS